MAKSYVRLTQPLVRDGDRAERRPAPGDLGRGDGSGGRRVPAAVHRHGPTAVRHASAARRRPTRSTSRPRSSPGRSSAATTSTAATGPDTLPSVAGLATIFGAGGGTSSYREVEETDLVVLWGSNARETHPIFFHHLLRGVHNGARLYAVDPRRTSSAAVGGRLAGPRRRQRHRARQRDRARDHRCRPAQRGVHRPGHDRLRRVPGPRGAVHARVRRSARRASRPTLIRELAHAYAKAPRAMICWTLGITEHHNAVDNVIALISLVAPHRPRRAAGERASTRCAARTTSRAAATWAPSPTVCPASSTSRTTRCGPASTPPGAWPSRRSAAGT